MINTLGFDTAIISYNHQPEASLIHTIEALYELGIDNFIFTFAYDPLNDSIVILKNRFKEFESYYKTRSPRRAKIKCAFDFNICKDSAFNKSVSRLYFNNASRAIFITLPIFTSTNYDPIALDVNHLLYKKSAFPIFTSFEKVIETSGIDFCSKFINNPKIGLSIDINYLLNPQKKKIFKLLIQSGSLILPSFSNDFSNYAGLAASTQYAIDLYGKTNYYKLCTQINKCSARLSL